MPNFRVPFNSFTSGECGESLEFRSDLALYQSGARQAENFFVTPQGPLQKRPGFARIQPTSQWDAARRLFPFSFSTQQSYLFGMGGLKCKIFKDDAEQIELTVPWTDDQLSQLRIVQSFDTFLGFHEAVAPRKIVRQGSHTSWAISTVSFDYWPYYRFSDAGTTTVTPSGTSGSITLTASAALWDATWVGVRVRLNSGVARITSISSSTSASATTEDDLSGTGASSTWEEQAWSDRRGWPRCGSFHQGRLLLGGTTALPQTLWGSRTGLFFDFNDATGSSGAILDDDGFEFTLSSNEVNAIYDMFSVRGALQVFTSAAEWVEGSKPITATQVSFQIQTRHGMTGSGIRVTSIDSDALFVDRTGRQVRAFSYDFAKDAFVAKNLTVIAPHVCVNPVDAIYLRGFAGTQANYAVFCNADGELAVLSLDQAQQVLGWSRFSSVGLFKSIAVLNDVLYTIQSYGGHRFITKLTTAAYVDLWGYATSVSPTTTWGGFTSHASQTVTVVGDGFVFQNVSVTAGGAFTLPSEVSEVYVGAAYTATYESLPLAPAANGQLLRGNRIRKVLADITIRNSKDVWIDGKQIPLRKLGVDLLDEPIPEVDRTIRIRLAPDYGPEPTVTVESRLAHPMILNGLVVEIDPGM